MKLAKLSLQNKVITKETMTITFGTYSFINTGTTMTGPNVSDMSDASFD